MSDMKNTLIERYTSFLRGIRRSENTISSYTQLLSALAEFLNREHGVSLSAGDVEKVKGYMLSDYVATRTDLAPASRNVYVAYIKAFFKYCLDSGYITDDPSRVLRPVRIVVDEVADEQRIFDNVYTTKDVTEMLSNIGKRNYARNRAMVALILGTGLRVSELCSLNLGDMRNMENGTFACVRKGGGRYRVAIADFAYDIIMEYISAYEDAPDSRPLFMTEQLMRMNRVTAYRAIAGIQERVGKATGVHRLRHAFLSALNNACENTAVVRDVASHRSVTTTSGYMQTTLQQRSDAVSQLAWANA